MRLGTCLLPEGLTLQGAHHKLAGFCSALVAGYYAAVDNASIQRQRPIEALGQKCGMDQPDAIAVDLRGNVMTCQNTGAKGAHKIGHVADFDAIALDTATHFAFREECMACPVVQLCKGSCMFLEGEFFQAELCQRVRLQYGDHDGGRLAFDGDGGGGSQITAISW